MAGVGVENLHKRLLMTAGEWIRLQKYLKEQYRNLSLREPSGVKGGYSIEGIFQNEGSHEFKIVGDSTTLGLYSKAALTNLAESISRYLRRSLPEPSKDNSGNILYLWESPPLAIS